MRSYFPWKNYLKIFLGGLLIIKLKVTFTNAINLLTQVTLSKFKQQIFQLKVEVVRSCWALKLAVNLILIAMLTVYAVKQVKN